MNTLVPNYYGEFKCIADKCKNNCCIGWEIDIDADMFEKYKNLKGDMGDRLRNSIDETGEPHFILQKDDRCPFLNEQGLCDIIINLGEDSLCNVCKDHPRFRNFYTDFTELGLGMCCEEAARVILNFKEPFSVVRGDSPFLLTDEEQTVLTCRRQCFDMLQDRDKTFYDVICRLAQDVGLNLNALSLDSLCSVYLSLERLDDGWTDLLSGLTGFDFKMEIFRDCNFRIPFEQLACYFLYRHLPHAIGCTDCIREIKFAVVSCYIIGALCESCLKHNGSVNVDKMSDFARMYSAEVEYSDENMNEIFDVLDGDVVYGK